MPLAAGTRLGPYEILAPIGAGGMGEVYRARDTRLGRDVAIKVLPQHLADQPEIRARFEREAKTVSSLNHPNICVLYDVGRSPGEAGAPDVDYLVMELIEGDTLAARLRKGPLAAAELLRLGTQVADALDRAHRAGVVHRDLKPGNVMITRGGAKLMDFGLSRGVGMPGAGSGSGRSAMSQSPTYAQPLTAEGTLLGTFQYMSPEQLEGREADARSDIWALGCVLYEMATGRRAFEGRSQASLIAAILEREPAPLGEAPSGAPPSSFGGPPQGLERLVRSCLAKDPDERVQTAHDVRLRLQDIAGDAGLSRTSVPASAVVPPAATVASAPAARVAWAAASIALLGAIAAVAWLYPRASAPRQAYRFTVDAIGGTRDTFWPRLSPDGRYLLMQATDSAGVTRAYARRMDQTEANPIPGTERLRRGYWSPDGREIAFVADDKIQRVPIAGGSPTVICAASGGVDLSWGAKGMMLMDGLATDSLRVVPAAGGELKPASRVYRRDGEFGSAWPHFLPDGEHFLFIGNTGRSSLSGNIRLGKLGSLDSRLLGRSDGRVEYAPGGWVLYLRQKTLTGQKLDLAGGRLTGEPITIADDVRIGAGSGHFSASASGALAFAQQGGGGLVTLRQVDARGTPVGAPIASGNLRYPALSPDGRRLLYQKLGGSVGAEGEIHVVDLERATDTQLTFTGDSSLTPVWAPDGRRFACALARGERAPALLIGSADGLGALDTIPLPGIAGATLSQWSPRDGRLLFFDVAFRGREVASEGPDRRPRNIGDSTTFTAEHQVSPDGRWLAYESGTTAANVQIYVISLEGPAGRWQISTAPALYPVWTRDGHELVYEGFDGRLMAVDIDATAGFRPGTPHVLFQLPAASIVAGGRSWHVDAKGERFFVSVPNRQQRAQPIEVVTDFGALVKRK